MTSLDNPLFQHHHHQHHHAHSSEDGDDTRSHTSTDVIDQILENYNFIFNPEVRLKFKQQLPQFTIGVAYAKPWHHRARCRLVLKPNKSHLVSKAVSKVLVVPTHGLACLYSSKIPLKFLRLQFMASYNWLTRQPTLDYRLTTKWSEGTRIKRKETYNIGKQAMVRAKWNLDLHLPDLEGHLGGAGSSLEAEALDVDYGHMDFEISQVDIVLHSPWDYHPPEDEETAGSKADITASTTPSKAGSSAQKVKVEDLKGGPLPAAEVNTVPLVKDLQAQAAHAVLPAPYYPPKLVVTGGKVNSPSASQGIPDWLVGFLSKLSMQSPPAKQ